MISVLTLTYQRHNVLEEAIQSFLLQNFDKPCEMVIINDSPQVKYTINNPKVRIVNFDTRFSSISKKIEAGYKYCQYDYIYRLDDDDLLAPNALNFIYDSITKHPEYEVYSSKSVFFFGGNQFQGMASNVNNGNMYKKSYLDRIQFNDESFGEDVHITYGFGGRLFSSENATMCYRWGGPSYHISAWGSQKTEQVLSKTDAVTGLKESGIIELNPHFNFDYFSTIPIEKQITTTLPVVIQTTTNLQINKYCTICGGEGKLKRVEMRKYDETKPHLKSLEIKYIKCTNCHYHDKK